MEFLIIKTSSLGDIIQTFPVIDYLKSKFPDCEIDWVSEKSNSEIIKNHPDIRSVIEIDSKKWRKSIFNKEHWNEIKKVKTLLSQKTYQAVFDLQGNTKSGLILHYTRTRFKVGFGWNSVPEKPNLLFTRQRYNPLKQQNIRDDYLSIVQQFFKDPLPFQSAPLQLYIELPQIQLLDELISKAGNNQKVMICPGAAWENKRLPLKTWQDFLQKYHAETGAFYFFVWGNQEEHQFVRELCGSYPSLIVDKLSLSALQNLMCRMDLVVAMDSLCLHLAGTTSTSTFSIFGPSSMQKYKPEGIQHIAMQGKCPFHQQFEKRCSLLRTCQSAHCMKDRRSEEMLDVLLNFTHGTARRDGDGAVAARRSH